MYENCICKNNIEEFILEGKGHGLLFDSYALDIRYARAFLLGKVQEACAYVATVQMLHFLRNVLACNAHSGSDFEYDRYFISAHFLAQIGCPVFLGDPNRIELLFRSVAEVVANQ